MLVIQPSTIKITCDRCKAVLGVTVTDVSVNEFHGSLYSCSCVECGREITLRSDQIPKWWVSRLHPGE